MNKQIIFFDGVCNLCNGFIDFVVTRDTKRKFLFAPLQGKAALEKIGPNCLELKSVVLVVDGKILEKSAAVLTILPELGGAWPLVKIFWIVPRFLRDFVYDFIAANRYRIFGKRDSCRLPTKEERALFLD